MKTSHISDWQGWYQVNKWDLIAIVNKTQVFKSTHKIFFCVVFLIQLYIFKITDNGESISEVSVQDRE